MVVIFATWLRRAEKADRDWLKRHNVQVLDSLNAKVQELRRIADLMERLEKREKDKEFHQ